MTVEGAEIHASCYCCCVCMKTGGLVFRDSCFYCETHHAELFLNKCISCNQRISGQFFKLANGAQAHS